jgi:hypothetical protein
LKKCSDAIAAKLNLKDFLTDYAEPLAYIQSLRVMDVKHEVTIDVPLIYYHLKQKELVADEFLEYFPSYKALNDEFSKKNMAPGIIAKMNQVINIVDSTGLLILLLSDIYMSKYDFKSGQFRIGRRTAIPQKVKFADKTTSILRKISEYNDVQSKATMNLYSAYGQGLKSFFKAVGSSISTFYCELVITNANVCTRDISIGEEEAKGIVGDFNYYTEPYEETQTVRGIDDDPKSINAYIVIAPVKAKGYRTTIGAIQKSVECEAKAVIYYTPKGNNVVAVQIP